MKTLEGLLTKYNWPTKGVSDNDACLSLENEIGFDLPEDYKFFLSHYLGHETQIGEESFKLWDKTNLLSWNQGYKILEHLPNTIGIGDNGGPDFIAIQRLSDGHERIVLTPFIDLDEQCHIEIGISFTDFLARMDKGEKWFKDIGNYS